MAGICSGAIAPLPKGYLSHEFIRQTWLVLGFEDKTEKKPGFVARMKAAVKGFCNRVAKFFRDTKSELKKVVWPSKEDTKTNTVVVLVTVAIAAVVMIALDAIFGGILGLIIGA